MFVALVCLVFITGLLIKLSSGPFWKWRRQGILVEFGIINAAHQMLLSKSSPGHWLSRIINFGPLVAVNVFGHRWIFINDAAIGEQVLTKNLINGRPNPINLIYDGGKNGGFVFEDGQLWNEQRKLVIQNLNPRTGSRRSVQIQNVILDARQDFIELLRDEQFSPNGTFFLPLINSIWMTLTGQRFDEAQLHTFSLADRFLKGQLTEGPTYIAFRWKWIRRIFSNSFSIIEMRETFDCCLEFAESLVDEYRGTFASSNHASTYIDDYLQQSENSNSRNSSFAFAHDGKSTLVANLVFVSLAGSSSLSSAIEWCILHLCRNIDIQKEIQDELDTIVGRDRLPAFDDMSRCPKTVSFIYEVLRINPPFKVTPMRTVTDDCPVDDIVLNKGDWVFLNINGIQNDPSIWMDPEKFRPSRFLNSHDPTQLDKLCVKKLVVFGMGKRHCPGQKIAMDNLFIFVSSICHQVNLNAGHLKQEEFQKPICQGKSMFSTALPFSVLIERRT